ncbi:hypothetical protein [Baia soyae]|uniref:Uncharacterized protein n=1 Tax=Baia soyae TaxID=1544746 RepID=A0A4R2RXW9_9BACL|nr:hypothetical protein [Baia soyae]TCP68348.1 hypothetical protein EDD57_11735 [Baia soyae]
MKKVIRVAEVIFVLSFVTYLLSRYVIEGLQPYSNWFFTCAIVGLVLKLVLSLGSKKEEK